MKTLDALKTWLNAVGATHSGSKLTAYNYKRHFEEFLTFIEASAEELVNDYEHMSEKDFKRKHSKMLRAYIATLYSKDYAPNTLNAKITPVLSFFKYHDLPLGFIPLARSRVVYHNRDITRDEIRKIIAISRPRERAFFIMMAQSGLRPITLCGLKVKHLEPDFSKDAVPCKVTVPQELAKGKYQPYFSFIGEETIRALKAYFTTRPNLTRDSPLFSGYGEESERHRIVWVFTSKFREAVRALKQKHEIDYEEPEGKPAELRLYNLRKWFRKMAYQAGSDFVEFWMGHKGKGMRDHYRPQDAEFHRQLYKEKAMPFLRIEAKTPTETERIVREQQARIEKLEEELKELRAFAEFMEKKPAYYHIPDDLHGEERLKALTKLVQGILVDIEEIKKSGKDFWEKSADVEKAKKHENG